MPAFLFYLLVLQPLVVSRGRLAAAALLVPVLALLMYRVIGRWPVSLSSSDRIVLLTLPEVAALILLVPLSQYWSKTYLFAPEHSLSITAPRLESGQSVDLRQFKTALGDVSFDALTRGSGWKRTGDGFSASSGANGALTWRGWTADQASLSLSGTPGAAVQVVWDGQARTVDLASKGGRADVAFAFSRPWWGYVGLALILFGSILFLATLCVLGSQIRSSEATLPAWAGWALLLGLMGGLALLSLNLPLAYLQVSLAMTATLLLAAPMYVLFALAVPRLTVWRGAAIVAGLRRFAVPLTWGCAAVIALAIFGQSTWTNWAMRDDHEIMLYVGPGRPFSLAQMLQILPHTEMGQFGLSLRFRPAYYFLRLLECVVWGAQPTLWHAFRIVILIVAIAIWWRLTAPTLGWLGAGLLCAYALTFPYWSELIAWLGPSETYAVAGLPIYVWGLVEFFRMGDAAPRARSLLAAAAVLGGGIICIGSKESFVLLAAPSLWLAYRGLRTRNGLALACGMVDALFAIYVGLGVLLAVSRAGVDIYNQSVSPAARAGQLLTGLRDPQNLVPIATLLLLVAAVAALLIVKRLPPEVRRSARLAAFWLAVLILIYISQLGFYNGAWPTASRYDYPGLLYIPAAVFILFGLGLSAIPAVQRAWAKPAAQAALAITLLGLTIARGYGPIIQSEEANIAASEAFVRGIEHIASVMQAQPERALVIESGSVSEYEEVYSYEEFLRAYGVNNTLFLRLHGYPVGTEASSQDAKLSSLLVQLSASGNNIYDDVVGLHGYPGPNVAGYAPLSQLPAFGAECYSLMLSHPVATECQALP